MVDTITLSRRRFFDGWSFGALIVAALVLLPIVSVAIMALVPSTSDWGHLWSTTMPRYLSNSLILMACVGALSVAIGTGAAWLVVARDFPGRGVLQYALLMPLAIPSYIAAYALVDFLEYAGPLQSSLRAMFGWETARDYMFPEIRSRWAAIVVMSLSLYPYVYLFAREAFEAQGGNALDVSRSLGCSPFKSFLRVSLPMARPAIVAGAAIVMMEVLNDFGTVEFFAIQTMTTGIFSLWLEAGDRAGAAEVACLMLAIVVVLLLAEKLSRKRRKFHGLSKATRPVVRHSARGFWRYFPSILCALPVLAGFVLPVSVLISVADPTGWSDGDLWTSAFNTLWLGFAAAIIAVIFAIFLTQAVRYSKSRIVSQSVPVTTIGYATPGAVLAIGILVPFALLDHFVADTIEAITGIDPGLFMTGSAAAIVFAYVVRFFAIPQGAIESSMVQITPGMDMAARSLGQRRLGVLSRIHLPMIKGAVATAMVLLFVDASKELPATLMLRPFNFDTLATRVYNHASLEDLERAAPAALLVTLAGLLPILILSISRKT